MWEKFQIGFWHPFGPYTGLSTEQVLDWKGAEIQRYGWTLWSFVYSESAQAWIDEMKNFSGPVFVLCSHSPSARDPDSHNGTRLATHYQYFSDADWQPMPDPSLMKVTNPFKIHGRALAFRVRQVIPMSPTIPPFAIQWYSRQEKIWCDGKLPTRGEYLVRRGGTHRARRVSAVLELMEPYLAIVKCQDSVE